MGLIKLGLLGGAAYFAVKSIKGDREKKCGRHRGNENNEGSRAINNEKQPHFDNSASQLPAYPVDQYPYPPAQYQYQYQYPTEASKQPQPQQRPDSPYQQMVFTDPSKKPLNSSEAVVPYANEKHVHDRRGSMQQTTALEQAMQHLNSGDQEKARQVLASAIGHKY